MRVDDMVRTGTEASAASADMASNRVTDAVNSGIVDSADKSHMAIKDSFLGPDRNSPEAQHGYGVGSTDGFSREGAVTFGSEAQRQADKLVSSGSVAKHAADALKQTGGKIAADGLVSSKADGRKLVSKANLKKAAKGAAVSEALRDSEFDGADEYYYKAKGAWKLGRKGADVVKKHAAARKAGNVSSGAGKATKVIEKKSTKKTGQAAQRAAQSARNQRMAMTAAQEAKAAGGAAKALAAKGAGGFVSSIGSGFAALLGSFGSVVAAVFAGLLALCMILAVICALWNAFFNVHTNTSGLSDTEVAVVNFLSSKGLDNTHIAAILGNMAQEAGGMHNIDPAYCQSNGPGRGLLQWEVGSDRFNKLQALAIRSGTDWTNINVQLEYMWSEMESSFDTYSNFWYTYSSGEHAGLGHYLSFSQWQTEVTDIAEATEDFERVFTRASKPLMDKRIAYAQEYLSILNSPSGGSGGMPLYHQWDPQWGNIPYGNGTISSSACGPTSFAMVVSYKKGESITPDQVVAWAGRKFYVSGAGTSWNFFGAAANYYGIGNVQQTGSFDQAYAALQSGRVVICSQGPGIFTRGGHFIVLRGLSDSGKILVNDPNDNDNKNFYNREFERSEITAAARQYFIFD